MSSFLALFRAPVLWLLCLLLYVTMASAITPGSGKQMCSALSAGDFSGAGVAVRSLKDANSDNDASAYCVYTSESGKVEFDIFYPAGETPDAVKGTETTVLREVGGKFENVQITGADSAKINASVPGEPASAAIVVRKKNAVFTITVPPGPNAQKQLVTLAEMVLGRLQP